jgi:hypothetical protein
MLPDQFLQLDRQARKEMKLHGWQEAVGFDERRRTGSRESKADTLFLSLVAAQRRDRKGSQRGWPKEIWEIVDEAISRNKERFLIVESTVGKSIWPCPKREPWQRK